MTQQIDRAFRCAECGRQILRLLGEKMYPLCAACLTMPGWMDDPKISALLAPDEAPAESPARKSLRRKPPGIAAVLAAAIWAAVAIATVAVCLEG